MAEEEKQQKLVKPYAVAASGLAAMVAALFTSKLGVAGTLLGTALTAMTINLGSAILSAQFEKASSRISTLPNTVRGRQPLGQARLPGKQSPEPDSEPAARRQGLLSRLRAIPGSLRNLSPARRRSVLFTGVMAGLAATVIGLAAVTGVEAAADETFSCLVWSCQEQQNAPTGATGAPSTSLGSVFGSSEPTLQVAPQSAPGEQQTPPAPGEQQTPPAPGEQQTPPAPGEQQTPPPDRQVPQQQQPAPDGAGQQPAPQQGADQQPGAEEPAAPKR